ncbi:unnamed protein product [Closterium sp. Yama58-4]|nr:unnamed protein product [Closterium sp. Yama58-4]
MLSVPSPSTTALPSGKSHFSTDKPSISSSDDGTGGDNCGKNRGTSGSSLAELFRPWGVSDSPLVIFDNAPIEAIDVGTQQQDPGDAYPVVPLLALPVRLTAAASAVSEVSWKLIVIAAHDPLVLANQVDSLAAKVLPKLSVTSRLPCSPFHAPSTAEVKSTLLAKGTSPHGFPAGYAPEASWFEDSWKAHHVVVESYRTWKLLCAPILRRPALQRRPQLAARTVSAWEKHSRNTEDNAAVWGLVASAALRGGSGSNNRNSLLDSMPTPRSRPNTCQLASVAESDSAGSLDGGSNRDDTDIENADSLTQGTVSRSASASGNAPRDAEPMSVDEDYTHLRRTRTQWNVLAGRLGRDSSAARSQRSISQPTFAGGSARSSISHAGGSGRSMSRQARAFSARLGRLDLPLPSPRAIVSSAMSRYFSPSSTASSASPEDVSVITPHSPGIASSSSAATGSGRRVAPPRPQGLPKSPALAAQNLVVPQPATPHTAPSKQGSPRDDGSEGGSLFAQGSGRWAEEATRGGDCSGYEMERSTSGKVGKVVVAEAHAGTLNDGRGKEPCERRSSDAMAPAGASSGSQVGNTVGITGIQSIIVLALGACREKRVAPQVLWRKKQQRWKQQLQGHRCGTLSDCDTCSGTRHWQSQGRTRLGSKNLRAVGPRELHAPAMLGRLVLLTLLNMAVRVVGASGV